MALNDAKYYTSIVDLPFSKFVSAYVYNDVSALIVNGYPDDSALQKAWNTIKQEYEDSIDEREHELYRFILHRVEYLGGKLLNLIVLLNRQKDNRCISLKVEINAELDTYYAFNWQDPELFEEELQSCYTIAGNIGSNIGKQLEMLKPLSRKFFQRELQPTPDYYSAILFFLSQIYSNKNFNSDEITVYQYCELLRSAQSYFILIYNQESSSKKR